VTAALTLSLALALGAFAAPAKVATEDPDTLVARLADPALPAADRPRLISALRKVHDASKLSMLFVLASSTSTPLDTAQAAWGAMAETALDSPKEARVLVPVWLKSADPEQRYRALQLIKEGVWDPSFVPLLRQMLRKDVDDENRAEAAETLADNDVKEARPDLQRALRDKSKAVREAAKQAIQELDTPEDDGP
jgi:HEAT repeat protein